MSLQQLAYIVIVLFGVFFFVLPALTWMIVRGGIVILATLNFFLELFDLFGDRKA